jgi:tetratricopeptide (TPR) repeat protein
MMAALDPKTKVELANLLIQIGFRDEAVAELVTAATILEREGNSEAALGLYKRILELDPHNQTALRRLEAARPPGRPAPLSEAIGYFRAHLSELPDDYARRRAVVQALLAAGILDRAKDHLNLLWQEARDPEAAQLWAEYYRRVGEPSKAADYLEAGIKLSSSKDELLELHYQLGELYEREGAKDKARNVFESLSQLDPNYRDVAERLARLRSVSLPEAPYPVIEERPAKTEEELPKLGEENISFL